MENTDPLSHVAAPPALAPPADVRDADHSPTGAGPLTSRRRQARRSGADRRRAGTTDQATAGDWPVLGRPGVPAPAAVVDLTDHAAVSVLIVDDHALLADSIKRALRTEGFRADTAEPVSVAAVIGRATFLRPTVALTDLDLGSAEFNGLDLIAPLADLGIQVVVLTSWRDRLLSAASLEAGATGIVWKSGPFADVVDMLRRVGRGEFGPDAMEADTLKRELRLSRDAHARRLAPFGRLSRRERDILASLVEGRSAETIAAVSYVSITTVRSQIQSVLRKLEVKSQLEAVAAATRCGWSGHEAPPMVRYSSTLRL